MTDYTGLEGGTVRERLRAVGVSLSLAIVGAVVGIGTLLVAATVLTAMGVSLAELVAVRYGVTVLSLQGVGFIVTVAAFLKAKDRFDLIRSRIPTLRDVGMIVGGVVGLLALLIGISALVAYLGLETPEPQLVEEGLENPEVMLLLIPLAYLFIGPGEELMFRGAVQGLLREAYAPVPAIVLASAIFALAHVTNVITAPGQQITIYLAVIFALSLLLGALYEYTENLVVPAFVHATYDAILFLSIYAQGSGMVG